MSIKTQLIAELRNVTDRVFHTVRAQWPDFMIKEHEDKLALAHRIVSDDATPTGIEFAKLYAAEAGSDNTPLSMQAWAQGVIAQEFYLLGTLRALRQLYEGGVGAIQTAPDDSYLPVILDGLYGQALSAVPAITGGVPEVTVRVESALADFKQSTDLILTDTRDGDTLAQIEAELEGAGDDE